MSSRDESECVLARTEVILSPNIAPGAHVTLRRIEGDETFDGQQRFLEGAATLATERRLSRHAFRAIRTRELGIP